MELQMILDQEGYEVVTLPEGQQEFNRFEVDKNSGKYLLIDLVGNFIDSQHQTIEDLEAYVRENIEPMALLDFANN
jgi:hypothetical protein